MQETAGRIVIPVVHRSEFTTDMPERIHLVTGRLAEPITRETVAQLKTQFDHEFTIDVLPITVAALMTSDWIAKHIQVPPGTSRVILPGYCRGDFAELQRQVGCPVEIGPKDVRNLGRHFGLSLASEDYGLWNIEIIAEINFAERLSREQLIAEAKKLSADGADIIDVGCTPGVRWEAVGDAVRALRDEGMRVSIDSFDPIEVRHAVKAGAELVLSVNESNREAAVDWGCEVVVIPNEPSATETLTETAQWLAERKIRFRLDPVLEPIGFGFGESLMRFRRVREQWPEAPMMMGVANISELTAVDSAGINMLLAAICEEWSIHSVLTTQVINWARSCVRELDVARQLARYAVTHRDLPKRVDARLIMLRDPEFLRYNDQQLVELSGKIRDHNYRVFVAEGDLVLMGGGEIFRGTDAFSLFDELMRSQAKFIDPSHAFYLGFELCKASIARQLSKEFRQDEALSWGMMTEAEPERHRLRRRHNHE